MFKQKCKLSLVVPEFVNVLQLHEKLTILGTFWCL
jgi:hypothetical protein